MPRLDNTSNHIIEEFELSFDPDDPGNTPPVDLCHECWAYDGWGDTGLEIDHPPYDENDYMCFDCKKPLTTKDN